MKTNQNIYQAIINLGLDYFKLLAVLHDIKPLTLDTVQHQVQKDDLIRLMKKLGLHYGFINDPNNAKIPTTPQSTATELIVIAKDIKKIHIFTKLYLSEGHSLAKHIKIGILLGYPDCCALPFINNFMVDQSPQRLRNYYYSITLKSDKFYSLINSIFCFRSRITHDEFTDLSSFNIKNNSYNINTLELGLIPYVPCSFDCKLSINYATKLLTVLNKEDPLRASLIMAFLSRPVLFFDTFKFIVFDGEADKKEIIYNDICPPFSLISDKIIKKIKQGNKLLVSDTSIQIYIDKKRIYTIKKENIYDGFIMPFLKIKKI